MNTLEITQKEKNEADCWIKIQFKRIEAALAFIQKNNSIYRNSMNVVFVHNDFLDKIENAADKAGNTIWAAKAREMLATRKYDDFMFVAKSDFPEAKIWDLFDDFLVVYFNAALNLMGEQYNSLMFGIASRGRDIFRLYFANDKSNDWDTISPLFDKYQHLCSDVIWEQDVEFEDYNAACDSAVNLTVQYGIMVECKKCGFSIYVDFLNIEELVNMYEINVKNKKCIGLVK